MLNGKSIIFLPCDCKSKLEEIIDIRTDDIKDDVHRFSIEYSQKWIKRPGKSKKEEN